MATGRLSDGFMLFSFRRFLEACGTQYEPIRDVVARAHLTNPTAHRQVDGLREEGYVETWNGLVRLTDAGLIEAARQSPSWTDLYDGRTV